MITTRVDETKHSTLEAKLPEDTDVVFVGAGPIGLAMALALKNADPSLKVVMAERFEEYQRKHNLILNPEQLQAYMIQTGMQNEPTLANLLTTLKKNPRIRTNKLEKIFKKLAIDKGVEIVQHKVTPDDLKVLPERTNGPSLIVGADGTHSVVSENLFPEGNQVKHDFDYVLQLRYDVSSEKKPKPLKPVKFFQNMAKNGMIADEYVGQTENKVTPVTMQMMISKQEFEALKQYTSKAPLVFDRETVSKLPQRLSKFVNEYLRTATQDTLSDIKISVNEAPATHAKKLVHRTNNVPAFLVGDAALGLSYFKGLNAGLESVGKLFSFIGPVLQEGLKGNKQALSEALLQYQQWFLGSFAPRKIKEVERYSTWRINAAWNLMRGLSMTKYASRIEYDYDPKYLITDYLANQATTQNYSVKLEPFPHRPYYPEISIWELDYVPLQYSAKQILKIATDYFTPYKSFNFQFKRELQRPLGDLALIGIGLVKLLGGFFTLNPKIAADGLLTLIRGALGFATFPLGWVVKPITKGIATAFFGKPNIEDNTGIQRLVKQGCNLIHPAENLMGVFESQSSIVIDPNPAEEKGSQLSLESATKIKHICFDLNRKFNKSLKKGQSTQIPELKEIERFNKMRESRNKVDFENYFALFAKKPATASELVEVNLEPINRY